MGVDVLAVLPFRGQALQFNAEGMDPAALKRQTGNRLCYEGVCWPKMSSARKLRCLELSNRPEILSVGRWRD
jgi:hypothetical protein